MGWRNTGNCHPRTAPQAKEEQKNGQAFLTEKQRRRARAVLFEAGRGHGYSGQGLIDYVDRQMAACN